MLEKQDRDPVHERFVAAIKLIRNEAAHNVKAAHRAGKPEDGERWLALYNALYNAYPEVCEDPNLTP